MITSPRICHPEGNSFFSCSGMSGISCDIQDIAQDRTCCLDRTRAFSNDRDPSCKVCQNGCHVKSTSHSQGMLLWNKARRNDQAAVPCLAYEFYHIIVLIRKLKRLGCYFRDPCDINVP